MRHSPTASCHTTEDEGEEEREGWKRGGGGARLGEGAEKGEEGGSE